MFNNKCVNYVQRDSVVYLKKNIQIFIEWDGFLEMQTRI